MLTVWTKNTGDKIQGTAEAFRCPPWPRAAAEAVGGPAQEEAAERPHDERQREAEPGQRGGALEEVGLQLRDEVPGRRGGGLVWERLEAVTVLVGRYW